jgi:hypothetical protein
MRRIGCGLLRTAIFAVNGELIDDATMRTDRCIVYFSDIRISAGLAWIVN